MITLKTETDRTSKHVDPDKMPQNTASDLFATHPAELRCIVGQIEVFKLWNQYGKQLRANMVVIWIDMPGQTV